MRAYNGHDPRAQLHGDLVAQAMRERNRWLMVDGVLTKPCRVCGKRLPVTSSRLHRGTCLECAK